MSTPSHRLTQARHWLPLGVMLALVVAFAVVAGGWVLGAADDAPTARGSGSPAHRRAAGITAVGGVALARVSGLGGLAEHLAERHRGGGAKTVIAPRVQRALVRTLGSRAGSGVVVDVAGGRLVAAAGSGGRSAWRTRVAPGATVDPVLAAGALDSSVVSAGTVLKGGTTLTAALASGSAAAFDDVQVRLDGWTVDELLRRVGFDAPVRAGDLRGFAVASRGPALTPVGVHGVGNAANFIGPVGRFRDAGTLARATTLQLAQVALALASDGRRVDVGVTRDGPPPLTELWSRATGRRLRTLLPDVGGAVAITGATEDGASVVAFTRTTALALTSADADQAALRTRALRLLTSTPLPR